MRFDLHVHTTFSDGDYTPREAAALAARTGLDGIAITDHDESRGYGDILHDAPKGLIVIPGIELAAQYGCEVHVLGLKIDWQDAALIRHVEKAASTRQQRAGRMLEKINQAGMRLTLADVETECEGTVIGRPHFAAALVKKGYASSIREAFSLYLSRHKPFYMPLDKPDISSAAALIVGAGGVPVLAHPGLMRKDVFDALAPCLTDMGFWGIEAYHPAHTSGQCREYESTARRYGLYVTAGSDFHGSVKPDIQIGQEQRGGGYLEKSIERLMAE